MIGKKINQLATELAPVSTDLTIIGDPTTGVSKKITLAQLGAIFSGAVSFYTNLAGFPALGDINVIYCAKDTKKLYLWDGTTYVEVFPAQALLDTYQLRSEKGVSNGYASLDSGGKVPISQLPSSIMEYKGTWNAATNTPTLANGTGDTGDVYICNVAGTVNFGAGAITFAVGDYVIYSGTIWQRSSGAVGTVTSVAVSRSGDALAITGSPITTSGTINIGFAGTGAQYIKGDGTLATFPTTIAQAERLITEVYNSTGATLTKGTIVYINGGQGNLPTVTKALATGDSTSAQTFGVVQADITNMNNGYVVVAGKLSDLDTQAYTEGTQLYLSATTAGAWTSTKQYAPNHLVYVGIVVRAHPTQGIVEVKIQNGYELDELHNVAAQTPTNNDGLFWESATSLWKNKSISTILGGTPITGSGNVNAIPKFTANSVLGNSVMEDDGNFVSMRGLKLNASAGVGNTINFQQGTGVNAGGLGYSTIGASSTTGFIFYIDQNTTSRNFILDTSTITSDAQRTYSMPATSGTLALVSQLTGGTVTSVGLSSSTSGVTIGSTPITTSGTITLAIATASGSQQGLLSSTDWTTFNNKQDALTNPVTGTGTTNYIPKFTGASSIGNSIVQDDGSTLTIGGALSGRNATFTSSTANIGIIGTGTFSYLQLAHNGGATKYSYLVATSDGVLDIEANIVKFTDYSGASERMRINASGNVSIGNTNDTYKLDVSGTGRFYRNDSGNISLTLTNAYINQGNLINFVHNSGGSTTNGYIGHGGDSTGNFVIINNSITALSLARSTGAATFSSSVTANGVVVLGSNSSSTPYALGTATPRFQLMNGGVYGLAGDVLTNGNTYLQSQRTDGNTAAYNLLLQPLGGNVGIGTTSPAYTLDVSGTGRFINATGSNTLIVSGKGTPYTSILKLEFDSTLYGATLTYDANPEIVTLENYGRSASGSAQGSIKFRTKISNTTPTDVLTLNGYSGAATFSSSVTAGGVIRSGSSGVTQGQLTLFSSTANAEGNIYGRDGGGLLLNTNGNNYPIVLNGSSILLNPVGNVGIGTTSPSAVLEVAGTSANTDFRISRTVSSSTYFYIKAPGGSPSTSTMGVNGVDVMALNASGNVGIGTTSPTTYSLAGRHLELNDAGGGYAFYHCNTTNVKSFLATNESAGLTALFTFSNHPLTFGTNNTERMRITSGGQVLIGQTAASGSSNGIYFRPGIESGFIVTNDIAIQLGRLGSTGDIQSFYSGTTRVGTISVSGSNTSYNTSSDYRLKEDLKDYNGLDLIDKIKTYDFAWKKDKSRNYGVIAHEIASIIPYVVMGEKDGEFYQGVDYSKIVPVLIKAIQEQQQQIEQLKNK